MYFILAMQTRKWICFYAVRKVTDNGKGLVFGGDKKWKPTTNTKLN